MSKLLAGQGAPARAPLLTALAFAAMTGACASGGIPTAAVTPDNNSARTDLAALTSPTQPAQTAPADRTKVEAATSSASAPAVLAEARRLRQAGDKAKALQVLDKAPAKETREPDVMREHGMLALELGHVDKARRLLRQATDKGPADWRTYSAYGSALSASGKQQDAQLQFAKALELAPDNPSVLNNLALSYALDGKHAQAEGLLRRVAQSRTADARTKQNLALLLGLQGRHEEAQKVSAAVLPADKARANARVLQDKGEKDAKPAERPARPDPRVPVASRDQGTEMRSAAIADQQPTYRLGGPGR